jgi:hypothetical protein
MCKLDAQTKKYFCECNKPFITGKSCQIDMRRCSESNKCLNNGTCIDSFDLTTFKCECDQSGLFYGQYCENMKNLCENVTCSMHGYCFQSLNEKKCKCFKGYEGDTCDIETNSLKIVKSFQLTSTIICLICFIIVWSLVLTADILSYLKIGHKRVKINEWKQQKSNRKNNK